MIHSQPASSSDLLCAQVRDALPTRPNDVAHVRHGALAKRFADVAKGAGSRPALRAGGATFAYGELMSWSESVAASLWARRTFCEGDRVVLMAPNSAAYIAGFYGTLLAGGVVVPVPVDMEIGRLESILAATKASCALLAPCALRQWPAASRARFRPIDRCANSGAARPVSNEPGEPDQLAAIFFTSGSSGSPKGVMLSHRNLLANAESIQHCLGIDETERALAVLPFPHAFGNSVLQSHLLAGAELVLDGSPVFPDSILSAVEEHQCTSFSAVPDLFRTLAERTSLGDRRLPSLRYMAVAGGALAHEVALDIAARIAPAKFFTMYGQTEATARLSCLPPEQLAGLPDCIGQGIPGVELQVVDDGGRPVAVGCVGEIRARGPNVMLGYWRDEAATAEVLRDGWLYTGDLATIDDAGRISIRGRKNAIVKIAGYRVHPREIEDFVLAHCPVRQAVVVPFESRDGAGTRLALFVQTSPEPAQPLTTAGLLSVCRRHLPRHRVPDIVQIVQQFPLTPSMKIDRQRLAEMAGALDSDRLRVA